MCSPCNRRYLFIIATVRSGSTTLLQMLNHLPNVRLSGENLNELYVTSLLASNLEKSSSSMAYDEEVEGAWMHHKIPTQAMACPIQQVINTINPPWAPSLDGYDQSTILGHKTVRFQEAHWSPSEAAVFFKESFPCSRIVVNIRSNTEGQAASTMKLGWSHNASLTEEELVKETEFLTELAENLGPDTARLIDMTMWTKNISVLNDLLDWLGYKECHFKSLVHANHDGYGADWSNPQIGDECHYPH